ncbi:hypothetical protein CHS0354_009429 [Potamilus streckersoni]|uniref:Uncharacterized protein n=1 Tax=Potamilus streckersoni TaxID=2493646 RepID=A0AAE0W629_9BIVA|nr:hypothetical protein CHS0354_009429 [Potamilus streckersoni]
MRDYCGRDLNMMVLNINAGRLLLVRDQNEARDCAVTVVSWYLNPYIQIQFEGLDLRGRYLTLMDGGENSNIVTGLPRHIVGLGIPKGWYSTTTRFLRIYLSQFQSNDNEDKSEFSIVFNSFDTGK